MLGVSADPLGVDLEQIRPMPRAAAFAERWFHEVEQGRLAEFGDGDRLDAFFRIWTAKEAALKLLGKGVGEALPRILTPTRDGWATALPANDLGIARCWITRCDRDGSRAAIATVERPSRLHAP